MRHNKKRGMKLGTDASHTKAMKKSLVASLLANDRIKTTTPRAKAIRTDVDRVITWLSVAIFILVASLLQSWRCTARKRDLLQAEQVFGMVVMAAIPVFQAWQP